MNLIVLLVTAAIGALIASILLWNRDDKTPERPRALVDRENRVKAGFEDAPVGIAYIAPQSGQWLQFNGRFSAALGYSRETLLRTSYREITHPEDRKLETKYWRQLQEGSIRDYTMEKRVQQRDGKYRTVRVSVSLCRVGGEEFFNCVAENSDEWRQIQGKIDFLEGLIESADDRAIISIDPSGTITNWNRGAEKLFGYTAREAIGMQRGLLYKESERWADKPGRDLRSATHGRISEETARQRKDGHEIRTAVTIDAELIGDEVIRFVETVRLPVAGQNVEQYRQAYDRLKETSETRINALTQSIDGYRAEIEMMQGQIRSLNESTDEHKVARSDLTNETKLITDALRREMGARRAAEQILKNTRQELAALDAKWKEKLAEEDQREREREAEARAATERESYNEMFAMGETWGSLEPGTFQLVLEDLASQKRTGTLLVAKERIQKEIFLEKGRIFSSASNDSRFYLAEMLIRDGLITDEQRTRAIEMQKETKLPLGRMLLLMNAITEEQLVETMREKVETEIRDLCYWTDGKYFFSEGPVPSLQLVPLRIRVDALFAKIEGHGGKALEATDAEAAVEASSEAAEGYELARDQGLLEPAIAEAGAGRTSAPQSMVAHVEFEEIYSAEKELQPPAPLEAKSPEPEQPSLFDKTDVSRRPTQPQNTKVPPDLAGYAEREEQSGWEEVSDAAPVHIVEQEHAAAVEYAKHQEESGWEQIAEPPPGHAAVAEPERPSRLVYVGSSSKKSTKYHRASCASAKKISAKLRIDFASAAEAESRGLAPCRTCISR